jgi:hypothetical protein
MGGEDSSITLLALMIQKKIGEALISFASSSVISFHGPVEVADPTLNEQNLSSFSSRGPTVKNHTPTDTHAHMHTYSHARTISFL